MTTTATDVHEATVTISSHELASLEHMLETVEEALVDAQRALAADDYGWAKFGETTGVGFDRAAVKDVVRRARVMAVADPLIRRAVALHVAYVWGQGAAISAKQETGADQDINAIVQAFLDDPSNVAAFTSAQAHEAHERKLQTDGELFHALITAPLSGRVQVRELPAFEVADVVTNPEDAAEVWFYRREFHATRLVAQGSETVTTSGVETIYYPDINFRPATRARFIDGHPVAWDSPVIHTKVNAIAGRGTPDVWAAIPWALGYKSFLEDWATLIKALSRFAFRATAKNRAGATAARATIAARPADATGQVGQTVITGEGQSFEAIGKSGATIDSESGRPMAAMVAAATNVPVTMLLADPGVTGARATAETLDAPLHNVVKARRTLHADLHRAVLHHVIREAVRAPQGPLRGTIRKDPTTGRELVALLGDQPIDFDVSFPSVEKTDPKTLMEAIAAADGLDKLPDLLIVRLAMLALGVEDVDAWLEKVTDENGEFMPPADAAAAADQERAVVPPRTPRQDRVAAGDVVPE